MTAVVYDLHRLHSHKTVKVGPWDIVVLEESSTKVQNFVFPSDNAESGPDAVQSSSSLESSPLQSEVDTELGLVITLGQFTVLFFFRFNFYI